MQHIKICLDESEIELISEKIRETIRQEARSIVAETLAQHDQSARLYTTKQAAEMLGCSVPTLRKWRQLGKIRAKKTGASFMYSAKAIADAHSEGIKYQRI